MKKTLVSIAAASLIVSSAMAADKGIDIVTTGQAVVYYQTASNNGDNNDAYGQDTELFSKGSSKGNVGVQLNLDADLKNDFTFGSQLTYIGTAGLEGNLVSGTMQGTGAAPGNIIQNNDITNEIALTQIFVAKKIANTTVKIGRQELPQALSPFAYSEDWNVFKNTFEAGLIVNTDLPDTTLVGAYVSAANSNADLGNFNNVANGTGTAANNVTAGAYMLTAQNKSIPMTTVTASYYDVAKAIPSGTTFDGITAAWGDIAVADKSLPMGLKVGVQGGKVMVDTANLDDTSAFGVKLGLAPIENLTLCAAYTSVDDGAVPIQNIAGVKSPLYTQLIANNGVITTDNNTIMLKAAYAMGDIGTVILQGTQTSDESIADNDLTDIELVYKVNAGGVDFLAAYINQAWDNKTLSGADGQNIVRLVARYAF